MSILLGTVIRTKSYYPLDNKKPLLE